MYSVMYLFTHSHDLAVIVAFEIILHIQKTGRIGENDDVKILFPIYEKTLSGMTAMTKTADRA